MSANMVALAYLIAAVLIIFALKGLSSPESSRRGNLFGMIGMLLAIVVTLQLPGVQNYAWIFAALAVGGLIGGSVARRIPMTHMPQLVALMHSLVGLAAVLIAVSAFYDPAAYGIATADGGLHLVGGRGGPARGRRRRAGAASRNEFRKRRGAQFLALLHFRKSVDAASHFPDHVDDAVVGDLVSGRRTGRWRIRRSADGIVQRRTAQSAGDVVVSSRALLYSTVALDHDFVCGVGPLSAAPRAVCGRPQF